MTERDIDITIAVENDAHLVAALTARGFAEYASVLDPPSGVFSESLEDVRSSIRAGAAVARIAGVPAGAVRWEPRGNYLYAGRLATVPECRLQGVASALMAFVENRARQLGVSAVQVEVRSALPGNIAFFEKRGFSVVSIDPHPRDPSQTSVTMRKDI
ncbi:MAG: GNAT family N-acetyltransferase [Thermomicrobiales bacterium]